MIVQPSSPGQLAQTIPVSPDALAATQGPAVTQFATSLKPRPERLKEMIQYGMTRMWEVAEEMGRNHDGEVLPNSWMGLRVQNKMTYDNDLEWRKAIGDIFKYSNFTLGTNRRYARLLTARVCADLLGTTPFFGAMSRRNGNAELTQAVEMFVQERVDTSNIPEMLREALKTALICNEAVVKTTYLKDESPFLGPAYVAVDQRGVPIMTPTKQLYIYPNDAFVPDPNTQGLNRLLKDPSYATAQKPNFRQFSSLAQKLTKYDNVFGQVLDCRDFFCPLKSPTTWQADINVHIYEENPARLREIYGDTNSGAEYFNWRRQMTGLDKPRRMQGEFYEERSEVLPTTLIAEMYLRFDADEDGREEEVMLVLDISGGMADRQAYPVFYDYLGNHMKTRPFSVIPGVEKEEKRWYGKGVFTKMFSSGLYIDTQINRINEKSSQNSSIFFRHRNAVDEWKAGEEAIFGTRKVYNVNEGWDAKNRPPIFKTNLSADAELDMALVDRMLNASDAEFGVITQQAASDAKLNASKTATGVISSDKDASVLSQDTETGQIAGLVDVLWQVTHLALDQMDPVVMQFSKDGKSLAMLNRDEARNLERDVRLLLTKTRSTAMIQANSQAEAIALRYYQLDPQKQSVLWPLYVAQLKGLEIDDAEDLLIRPTPQDIQAYKAQQAQAAQQEAQDKKKPPAASIASKLTDFVGNERSQVLTDWFEIQPESPTVVDAHAARTDATEIHKKVAIAEGTAEAKEKHAPPRPQSAK